MGRSKLLRSSYFWLAAVPLAAKLLAKVPDKIAIPVWEQSIEFQLALPFSWVAFYFAAVAFAAASAIYSAKCPYIISHYSTFSEYREEGRGPRDLSLWLSQFLRRNPVGWEDSTVRGVARYYIQEFCSTTEAQEALRDEHKLAHIYNFAPVEDVHCQQNQLSSAFWYLRDKEDHAHPRLRVLCGALYAVGFALMLVVITQNIAYVAEFML